MVSLLPKEETIIDPLYEPLKLNRYELCSHLTMLSNVSHLRYGFSPYLLFDVEGWKEVVKVTKEEIGDCNEIISFLDKCEQFETKLGEYLKQLEKLPGMTNNKRNGCYGFLVSKRDEIEGEYKQIKISYREILNKFLHGYLLNYNDVSNVDNKRLIRFLMNDPNIGWEGNAENQEIKNGETIRISDSSNDGDWVDITIKKTEKKAILKISDGRTHNLKVKEENGKLSIYLDDSNKFKENFEKITHLFRLDYPVEVKCPKSGEKRFMCEEGKIYSMKEALLRTFELRRARWLQMSGSLHTIHRASTHTRLSHQIGSIIAGVNALREIDIYPRGDLSMSLGEYLLMSGELHEFLMANFLHDIGHSPLSHVLEPNPFIELDHEEITRNLIRGKKVEGDREGGTDWYVAERYLLKMKAIRDFEHRFLENQYDSLYDVGEKENWKNEENRKNYFLEYLKDNKEILESEVVVVNEVLENFGVDKDRVVEILSGKIFCPSKCGRLLKIEDGKVEKCKECGAVKIESKRIYDTQFLNKLIESEIDIDRMDHVKRDSVVCGLSLTSFRLLELLGSMSVVLPDSAAYTEIYNQKRYVFSWDNIPEDDSERLLKYLRDAHDINWTESTTIDKSDDGKTICIFNNDENSAKIMVDEAEESATLEISDGRTHNLTVGKEDGKLNIYQKSNRPYILISENGLLYVMDLLNARKSVFNDVLYSDENNWINGVVNQITALTVRSLPHIKNMLPFITDQILMHFYTNDLFLGTQIEKLNKLFHGKMDCSGYGDPMRYKLKDGMIVTEKKLQDLYKRIEKINDDRDRKYEYLELPAVVFYTNIKFAKCSKKGCDGKLEDKDDGGYKCNICGDLMEKEVNEWKKTQADKDKKKRSWDDIFVYGKKFVTEEGKKFVKFTDLVEENKKYPYKYQDTSREVFPTKPNELDVKKLLYVWVSDFVVSDENSDRNNGAKSKNEWRNDIKKEIGDVWVGVNEMFVDLDDIEEVKNAWIKELILK